MFGISHVRISLCQKAQNAITVPFLGKCEVRGAIEKRLTELWNYPKYSCPYKVSYKVMHELQITLIVLYFAARESLLLL